VIKHGEVLVFNVLLVELGLEIDEIEGWYPDFVAVKEIPDEARENVDV
jgi:hypothetical protein